MKKLITLSLFFSAIGFSGMAQEKSNMKHDHDMKDHPGKMMKMKELNLTEAQKKQIKDYQEDYKKQIDQLKLNQSMTVKEFNDKKEALRRDQKAKMEAVLTPDQKGKLEQQKLQFESDRKAKMEKQLAEMKTKLSLTDDQVKRLTAQRESLQAKMKAVKEDQTLNQESRREKMMALKKESEDQRNSILTADQVKKLEELRKSRNDATPAQPQQ